MLGGSRVLRMKPSIEGNSHPGSGGVRVFGRAGRDTVVVEVGRLVPRLIVRPQTSPLAGKWENPGMVARLSAPRGDQLARSCLRAGPLPTNDETRKKGMA